MLKTNVNHNIIWYFLQGGGLFWLSRTLWKKIMWHYISHEHYSATHSEKEKFNYIRTYLQVCDTHELFR